MLIYINGDSFTAGVHLFDEIFPGYPGEFTKQELVSRRHEIKLYNNIKGEYAQKFVDYQKILNLDSTVTFFDKEEQGTVKVFNNIEQAERQRAYPAIMQQLDNSIQTINSSVPGASIGGICFRTTVDLLDFKSKNIKIDRAIIQLTSPWRYEIYDHTQKFLMYDRPVGSFKTDQDNAIGNAVALKYIDEDYIIKYLYNLTSIIETVNSVTGHNPIFIDSNNEIIIDKMRITRDTLKDKNPDQFSFFEKLVEHSHINTTHYNFMEDAAQSILEKGYLYDGHYSYATHKEVAKRILSLL